MAAFNPRVHELEPVDALSFPLPSPGLMTEDDFAAWCRAHEEVRAEWVDGEVVIMSPVNYGHLNLSEFLVRIFSEFVESRDLGEAHGAEFINRFRSGSKLVRRLPDLWFVTKDRLNLIKPTFLDGPPDLALEIVSPDSVARDYREKYLDYQAGGVREYWVIDPISKNIDASRRDLESGEFRLIAEIEGRISSEILPGFFLRPEWLWRHPLPKARDVLHELGV